MEGKSAYSMEQQTGIAQSLIRKYLRGASSPGADKLVMLARALDVSVGWLAMGEPPMRPGKAPQLSPEEGKPGHGDDVRQDSAGYRSDAQRCRTLSRQVTPTAVYARIMEPLLEQTDNEAQRECVLQRAIDILGVATGDSPRLMAELKKADLANAVALAVAVQQCIEQAEGEE